MQDEDILEHLYDISVCQMCSVIFLDSGDTFCNGSGSDDMLWAQCAYGYGRRGWGRWGISQSITPGDERVMLLHSVSNVLLSERGEQDVESETQSNAEENHNTDMDEERDVDMDADEEAKEEEEMGNEDGASSQVKDELLDKVPVVVLTANPTVEDKAELKVKDEAEKETKPVVEVRVCFRTMLPIFCMVVTCGV
jgi:hypothetical protein